MASEAELLALAERCEAARGANYALEVEIFKAMHPEYASFVEGRGGLVHPADGSDMRVLSDVRPANYTASLDAAMTLIPRETDIALATIGAHSYAGVGIERGEPDSKAATLPLAVCTTALRLRAATMGVTDDE